MDNAKLSRVIALGVRRREMAPNARRTVAATRKAGHLERRCCVVCDAANTVGHHVDYSKPLRLVWLCLSCHTLVHLSLTPRAPRKPRATRKPRPRPPLRTTVDYNILHRLGYHLRAARGGSGISDSEAGAALGVPGQTIGRRLAAPHMLRLYQLLELLAVYEVDPGATLTMAIEDAQVGRGLPGEEATAQMLADLKP